MHLALIGYGSIGRSVIGWLDQQPLSALTLLVRSDAISSVMKDPALSQAAATVQVTDDITTVITSGPDLVVECAGHGSVSEHCIQTLQQGLDTVVVSVGALADDHLFQHLTAAAEDGGGQLILPSGAIGGVDLLAALALADKPEVFYRGTKPPAAWRGTAAENHCDLTYLTQPTTFFDGSAREAARLYPKNANVAAMLAVACGSWERTQVQLIADPGSTGNQHSYEVRSETGRFAMQIESGAASGNAKTSASTAFSVVREINRRRSALVI